MAGINNFYETKLGTKLRNPMAWGAVLPTNTVALNVWLEEIVDGKVFVFDENIGRTKSGNINPNWSERKSHFDMIKSGVTACGVLISNGGKSEDDSWNIHSLNEVQTFKLSNPTRNEKGHWYMNIDLTTPQPAEEIVFDKSFALSLIDKNPLAAKTVGRATSIGWKLIGNTDETVSLSMAGKVMSVKLADGSYTTKKAM